MIEISLCMIVKDEEETLDRCLESVRDIADEIVIVDTGSTDGTKEIAKRHTDKIYDFEWVDDFSVARNYSFSKATKEYVMWLDADDEILENDRIKLLKLKSNLNPEIDAVIMRYDLTSRETRKVTSSFYRERIVKRERDFRWQDPVHEYIVYSGKAVKADIAVTHKKEKLPTRRNLEIFEKYIEKGNELSERNWFYYARELFRVKEFDKAEIYYEKFLGTSSGILSNYLDSCMELSECYFRKEEYEKSLKTLIRYFEIDGPRAEICCRLGYYYKNRNDYRKAISWFSVAPQTPKPISLGSVAHTSWDYVPYMELCMCHFKLGEVDQAIKFNEKAAESYPDDDTVCHNRKILAVAREELKG